MYQSTQSESPAGRIDQSDHAQRSLTDQFSLLRARTLALTAPLSSEDCQVQSMADASPIKWHLAHTSWFFETFILEPFADDYRAFDPAFKVLFNSYYNGIGDKHPRHDRGLLSRPSLDQNSDRSRACNLSQFFSTREALAVQRHPVSQIEAVHGDAFLDHYPPH